MNLKKISYRSLPYVGPAVALFTACYLISLTPGESYKGAITPTAQDLARVEILQRHVKKIASVEHNTQAWKNLENSKNYIVEELKTAGLEPGQQEYSLGGVLNQKVSNIEVVIEADETSPTKNQNVVIGAHYDSAEGAPGANDNGSGAAALIEIAKTFKNQKTKPKYKMRLVWFVNEEPPYFKSDKMGSYVYAKNLADRKEQVKAMYAFDMLGAFYEEKGTQHYPLFFGFFFPSQGNFLGFVSDLDARDLMINSLTAFRGSGVKIGSEGIAAPTLVRGIDYSDHWSFYHFGWNAIMITDTAFKRYKHYHTEHDTPEKINYPALTVVVKGLENMFSTMYF